MSRRGRYIFFVLALAVATTAILLFLTKQVPRRAKPAVKQAPNAEARGLDASGRTKAERLAIE